MRTSLSLALSLSINIALASENIKNDAINAAPVCSQIIYSDESDTTTRGALSDQRRRGDFEVKDDEKSTPPHVWALNIASETSRFCYIAQEEVSIWLPQREQTGSVVIKKRRSGKIELPWSASEETLAWPVDKMPLQSKSRYSVKLDGFPLKIITLCRIPAKYKTVAEKAEWMMQRGCKEQAEMLLKEGQNR